MPPPTNSPRHQNVRNSKDGGIFSVVCLIETGRNSTNSRQTKGCQCKIGSLRYSAATNSYSARERTMDKSALCLLVWRLPLTKTGYEKCFSISSAEGGSANQRLRGVMS